MRILTRESALALWQAEHVKGLIKAHHPAIATQLVGVTTKGDRILDRPLYEIGGKALFIKELETGLLNQEGDLAVHSLKDVPHEFPEGLGLCAYLEREEPWDALVWPRGNRVDLLPKGATIGTSSLRRMVQLKHYRPDLKFLPLRGNVNTRLQKCFDGEFDAIILAYAGLKRLDLTHHISEILPLNICLPAAGQGAIGIEVRISDAHANFIAKPLNHAPTATCIIAERALCKALNGSCQTPLAAFAVIKGSGSLRLRARLGCPKTAQLLEVDVEGDLQTPETLGRRAAKALFSKGAQDILDRCDF